MAACRLYAHEPRRDVITMGPAACSGSVGEVEIEQPSGDRLPEFGAWCALEWSHNLGSDPATIKITGLRDDEVFTDVASLHLASKEGEITSDHLKPRTWLWIAPGCI